MFGPLAASRVWSSSPFSSSSQEDSRSSLVFAPSPLPSLILLTMNALSLDYDRLKREGTPESTSASEAVRIHILKQGCKEELKSFLVDHNPPFQEYNSLLPLTTDTKAYRSACLKFHPDKGGNETDFTVFQQAFAYIHKTSGNFYESAMEQIAKIWKTDEGGLPPSRSFDAFRARKRAEEEEKKAKKRERDAERRRAKSEAKKMEAQGGKDVDPIPTSVKKKKKKKASDWTPNLFSNRLVLLFPQRTVKYEKDFSKYLSGEHYLSCPTFDPFDVDYVSGKLLPATKEIKASRTMKKRGLHGDKPGNASAMMHHVIEMEEEVDNLWRSRF